jgi:hypothetical protein
MPVLRQDLQSALYSHIRIIADVKKVWHFNAVQFDPNDVEDARAETEATGLPARELVFGMSQDGAQIARALQPKDLCALHGTLAATKRDALISGTTLQTLRL